MLMSIYKFSSLFHKWASVMIAFLQSSEEAWVSLLFSNLCLFVVVAEGLSWGLHTGVFWRASAVPLIPLGLTTLRRTSSGTFRLCRHTAYAEEWLKMTGATDRERVCFITDTGTWARSISIPRRFISTISCYSGKTKSYILPKSVRIVH